MFGWIEKLWDMGTTAFWGLLIGTGVYEYFKGYGVGALKLPKPHMVDDKFVQENHTPRGGRQAQGYSGAELPARGYEVRTASMDEVQTPQSPRTAAPAGRQYP